MYNVLDKVRKEKSTLSVEINEENIDKGSAKSTFVYLINYISNLVGKEKLHKDFPQIFSNEDFKVKNGKYSGHNYNTSKDDSNLYFIKTHTSTGDKKYNLERIAKNIILI